MQSLYNDSLGLLTDQYQVSMACSYWKNNVHENQAVFNLFFRKAPFGGDFVIAAGIEQAVNFVQDFHFDLEDCEYLKTLSNDGKPLFELSFLNYLSKIKSSCQIKAVPEGTVVFPNEPILQIKGPILQCQLLETALLNIINFQTLIATKAARICSAAQGNDVIEFGLRRAQGFDGGLSASRAAYIGGCKSTSNVLAGKRFGIPVTGTHAHSWVGSFKSELEAFRAYAFAMPHNCVLLVDTYDTIQGIKNAIEVNKELCKNGHHVSGIRLDSGDLCKLSIQAREMLDAAGMQSTKIIASNDLDEYKIAELKKNGCKIDVWGVGTNLVTGGDQSALGGVYKLASIQDTMNWRPVIKKSEDAEKTTLPGEYTTIRFSDDRSFSDNSKYCFDVLADPKDDNKVMTLDNGSTFVVKPDEPSHNSYKSTDLFELFLQNGHRVRKEESLNNIKWRAVLEYERFKTIPKYSVGISLSLKERQAKLLKKV